MPNGLNVNSYANVTKRCRITCNVNDSQFVDFIFGDSPNTFDFGLDVEALREFVKLGIEALREMDALAVREAEARQDNTELPAIVADELVSAGGQPA